MKKPIKKLISIMLSLMLVFSSTLVVFAEEPADSEPVITEEVVEEEERKESSEETKEDGEADISDEETEVDPEEEIKEEEEIPEEEVIEEETSEEVVNEDEEIVDETLGYDADYEHNLNGTNYIHMFMAYNSDFLFYYEDTNSNVYFEVAYYSGDTHTITFLNDWALDFIRFFEDDSYDGVITIDLNGHDVAFGSVVGPSISVLEPLSIYSAYELVITDDYGGGTLYNYPNEKSYGSQIFVEGDLTLKNVKLDLYDAYSTNFESDYIGIISANNITINNASINLDGLTYRDESKAGIYAVNNIYMLSGKIECDYSWLTAAIFAGGNYYQFNGKVDLYFNSEVPISNDAIESALSTINTNDLIDKKGFGPAPVGTPFAFGLAVGEGLDIFPTSSSYDNDSSVDILVTGGSLNVYMGNVPYAPVNEKGIVADGDIKFNNSSSIYVACQGAYEYDNSIPRFVSCIESENGNIMIDGYSKVNCYIGNSYDLFDIGTIVASNYKNNDDKGCIGIIGHSTVNCTLGNLEDFNYATNIYAEEELYVGGSSNVTAKIGNVYNFKEIHNVCSWGAYMAIRGSSSINANIGNIKFDEDRIDGDYIYVYNIEADADSHKPYDYALYIEDNAKVNATIGDIVGDVTNEGTLEDYQVFNIFIKNFSIDIDGNVVVNANIGNVTNATAYNITSFSTNWYQESEKEVGYDTFEIDNKATINASVKNLYNSVFCNIFTFVDLFINGASVNTSIGNVSSSFAANCYNGHTMINITGDSRVNSRIGDYYMSKNISAEEALMGTVDFYSEGGLNIDKNSKVTIVDGDTHYPTTNGKSTNNWWTSECINTDDLIVADNATLNVTAGYGHVLINAVSVTLFGGNTNLNLASYIYSTVSDDVVNSALIYIHRNITVEDEEENNNETIKEYDGYITIFDGNIYGYNSILNGGYGFVYEGSDENHCYLDIFEDAEVVLDVLSYDNDYTLLGGSASISGPSHLLRNITIVNIDSKYIYGSEYYTSIYGEYTDDEDILRYCRYVMFSYRPYVLPDFDDDTSDDTKHVVPNTGVYIY